MPFPSVLTRFGWLDENSIPAHIFPLCWIMLFLPTVVQALAERQGMHGKGIHYEENV